MSSTPNLAQISEAIVSIVSGITAGTGSYNYTVASVSRVARDIKNVPTSSMPAVDVLFMREEPAVNQVGQRKRRAQWLIRGYVQITATEPEAAATERMLRCARMKDDLKAALLTSSLLQGGVAAYADEGEVNNTASVDEERDSRGSVGTFAFELFTTYFEPYTLTPTLA